MARRYRYTRSEWRQKKTHDDMRNFVIVFFLLILFVSCSR